MPRDNDKNNDSRRGRRDGPPGGKGRSGAARGPDKKFAKRGFADKKFGDKRPYTPRGEGEKRPYAPRGEGFRKDGDRPERKFGGDKKFSRGAPDRGPRNSFGDRPDRGESKPWHKRDASSPDHAGRNSRPARNFDKPRFDKPRDARGGDQRSSRPREDRPQEDRPFRDRPKFDRPRERGDRPTFERPREARNAWHEHPRSERDERRRRG